MSVSFLSKLYILPPRLSIYWNRGTRAVGVEYVDDSVGRPKTGTPESSIAKASRLVVVSAGAFGSPAILERCEFWKFTKIVRCLCWFRSGIGGVDVLQNNDIHQIVDLPGVGENYMGKITGLKLVIHARALLNNSY